MRLPRGSLLRFFFVSSLLLFSLIPWPSGPLAEELPHTAEALIQALQELQFDTDRTLTAKDLSLHFEGVFLTFDRGRMVFTKPVGNFVTGLYFWGEGTIVVGPSNVIEKQQLILFTGAPTLNEHFREAYIRFTDNSYDMLMAQASANAETEFKPIEVPPERLQNMLHLATMDSYRIAADLLSGRTKPIFSARFRGHKFGMFDFIVDHRRREQISLGQNRHEPEYTGYDVWSSYSLSHRNRQDPVASGGDSRSDEFLGDALQLVDCRSFEVETRIDKDDKLTGTTRVEFMGEAAGEWVVNFDLSRFLKVTQVRDEKQRPLLFYQNNALADEQELGRLGQDLIMVLLKEPLRRGEKRVLEFDYSGEVISRAGKGIFYVGARGSWYPNTSILDRARYRLKFHFPRLLTIVATGDLEKEWEEGDFKHSIWTSEVEIPVAGFNYGDYVKKSTQVNNVSIEVYANRGVENVYMEVKARLDFLHEMERQRHASLLRRGDTSSELVPAMPDFTDFDTARFSSDIAARVARTFQFFEPLMTKYPYNKLAVSQIPGKFSQGWPSLLYVSSLAFLTREQRAKLGMETDREALFMECLPAHEMAHQWWGNLVGWKTYHDVWMMEGFSNYFGFLSIKLRYPTGKQLKELLHQGKEKILTKNSEGQVLDSAGPVWLTSRLNSAKFPTGYSVLVYEKGAWILHMLHSLLTDPATGSDKNFQLLITDFLTIHRNKLVSTDDFKRAVEKYMTKDMDLEGTRKMDWFFDEWVYGTGIPTYRISYSTSALKNGTYAVKGKILQENVSDLFMMPVDVFARFPSQRPQRIGRVDVSGSQTPFRIVVKSKPVKVTLDENDEILCENKTL